MNDFYRQQSKKLKKIFTAYPSTKSLIEDLYLRAILDSYPRVKVIPSINKFTENQIRDEFVRDFKNLNPLLKDYIQNKSIFLTAENQAYTKNLTQRTDIELFSAWHSHCFVIECKRLDSAESRYIHGRIKGGVYEIDGMEKFINLIYAEGEEEAAMLSFIIKSKPQTTTNKLRDKVEKFCPASDISSFITQKCIGLPTSFQSKHIRIDKSLIQIYHLFLDFR